MYYYHVNNTEVPRDLKSESFMAGFAELYNILMVNPNLRMVPIDKLDAVRAGLNCLGCSYRTRYRGPHAQQKDTHKADARAFTIYFKSQDRLASSPRRATKG